MSNTAVTYRNHGGRGTYLAGAIRRLGRTLELSEKCEEYLAEVVADQGEETGHRVSAGRCLIEHADKILALVVRQPPEQDDTPDEILPEVVTWLQRKGFQVSRIEPEPPKLEEAK